jgi:ABC-type branched-subunit amino acid transport system ATPase component
MMDVAITAQPAPAETTDYFLRLVNISKRFGGIHALENINLDVCPGEVLELQGDNGAARDAGQDYIQRARANER